jgi:iron complex outermembrane recepter protein
LRLCIAMLTLLVPASAQPDGTEVEAPPDEIIVVTAARTEQPITDAVSFVSSLGLKQLQSSPELLLDQALRTVPGFSLFRRSGSLVAHPTAQGVSLRGIGPSGTSRSLVLFDGIPLNDPFGGWVYWNRIPTTALDRVEVARGATSQLYGNAALGGVIQLFPRRPAGRLLLLRGQLGNLGVRDLEVTAGDTAGNWTYLVSGRLFDTAGYPLVSEGVRGSVDRPADSEFQTVFSRAYYKSFHIGLNAFAEQRINGTELQNNSSRIVLLDAGVTENAWSWGFLVQSTLFESTFSRISPDRSSETITSHQRVPATAVGASWNWHPNSVFLLGGDWRRTDWEEHSQNLAGLFTQALVPLAPSLDVLLGARLDLWENRETQTTVNPRVGVVWRAAEQVTLRSSGYRGFRAPTLNELYRPFRVGNIETRANEDLDEEHLWGGEAGAEIHPGVGWLFRLNGFWNSLENAVSNTTLSVSPGEIIRQRTNLGGIVARGLELEAILPRDRYALRVGYLYSANRVKGSLLHVPQAPRHHGFVAADYEGAVLLTLEGRWVGHQFEDDLNLLGLGSYPVFSVSARRRLRDNLSVFLGVENALDRRYAVGRTPVEQLGQPRLLHAGIFLDLYGRSTR